MSDAAQPSTISPTKRGALLMRYADVLLHCIGVAVVSALWLVSEDPVRTLYVGSFIVTATYLAIAILEMRRAPIIISPVSFYFLWYSIGVGVAAFSIASRVAAGEIIQLGGIEVRPSDLGCGYVLFLIGSAAFHLGLQAIRPVGAHCADPTYRKQIGARRYPGLLILVWMLGVVARAFVGDATAAGAVFGILAWASNAALCAYCLSAGRERPRISWVMVSIACLVEFAFNLSSLSKAYIMYSFMPFVWSFLYFPAYRKWLPAIAVGLIMFYLAIVAPVVTNARNDGGLELTGSHLDRVLKTYEQYSVFEADLPTQAERVFERQFDAIPIGFIRGEVLKFGWLDGAGLDYLAYAFIPRFLWPDKPAVTKGAWFTVYLGGASNEQVATTSTALTAVGELYWNFGLPGVVLGMILLGAGIGALWRIAGPTPQADPLRMLLYFVTIILMIDNAQAGVMAVGIVHRAAVLGTIIGAWAAGTRRRAAAGARRQVPTPTLGKFAVENGGVKLS